MYPNHNISCVCVCVSNNIYVQYLIIFCVFVCPDNDKYPWRTNQQLTMKNMQDNKTTTTKMLLSGKSKYRLQQKPQLVSKRYTRTVVSKGSSVTLSCTVENAGNITVSMILFF